MDDKKACSAPFDLKSNRAMNENKDNSFRAMSFYKQGKEFYLSAKYLFEHRQLDMMNVISTNLTFACELFLKSLLYYSNKSFGHTHGLKQLFNMLGETEKDFIKENVFANSQYQDDFELCLSEQNDAFVEYRYICEVERYAIDFNFLFCFANILEKVCSYNLKNNV